MIFDVKIIILLFMLGSILFFSNYLFKSIINPASILSSVFIISIISSSIITENLNLSVQLIFIYELGIISFAFFSYIPVLIFNKKNYYYESTLDLKKVKKCLIIIVYINILFMMYKIYILYIITDGSLLQIFLDGANVRDNIANEDFEGLNNSFFKLILYILNIGQLAVPLASVFLFFTKKKSFLIISLLVDLMISLSTLERSYFFQSVIWFIMVYLFLYTMHYKKIKLQFILKFTIITSTLFFLLFIPYTLRNPENNFYEFSSQAFEYLGCSNLSFNESLINSKDINSQEQGMNTFYGFYKWFYKFKLINSEPQYHLQYIEVKLNGNREYYNTYTYLYYFYKDFGLIGVFIINSVLGFLFSYFYLLVMKLHNIQFLFFQSKISVFTFWFFYSYNIKDIVAYLILFYSIVIGKHIFIIKRINKD